MSLVLLVVLASGVSFAAAVPVADANPFAATMLFDPQANHSCGAYSACVGHEGNWAQLHIRHIVLWPALRASSELVRPSIS